MSDDDDENENIQYKVTMVGNSQVGKTSILLRYTRGEFPANTQPTIGSGSITVTIERNSQKVNIQIWDTAGQERFRSLLPLYLRGSRICIFVYAINDRQSFIDLENWIEMYKETPGTTMDGIILGNKSDLEEDRQVTFDEGHRFAKGRNLAFYEISALKGDNVSDAFEEIIYQLLLPAEPDVPSPIEIIREFIPTKNKCC